VRHQCLASRDPRRLLAFDLGDRAGGVEHLIEAVCGNEEDAVIVGEHDVVTCGPPGYVPLAEEREADLSRTSDASRCTPLTTSAAMPAAYSSSTDGDSLTGDQSP
jgi:hypothetical protein